MTKQSTLGLGMVTAGIAVALAAFLLFASQAFAAGSVTASATEAQAGGTSTVTVTATAGSGHGIGNYTIDLTFEPLDYTGAPTACTSNAAGSFTINPAGASGIVRFAGATGLTTGLTGEVVIGTCEFTPAGDAGDCSDVGITIGRMDDENGTDLGASASGDEVCVAAAVTASPSPAPGSATTAAPQPSKAVNTGGSLGSSDNGVSSLTWLLGITGMAIVAAGAWTLSRARREI